MLEDSVKIVALISETDSFVYAKLDTPKQKVQSKINFNWLKGKFKFLNFFTMYKIKSCYLSRIPSLKLNLILYHMCYFFCEGYFLGKCRLSILFTKVYSETSFSKTQSKSFDWFLYDLSFLPKDVSKWTLVNNMLSQHSPKNNHHRKNNIW